jgi:16S rRNA (cytosine1407-C5)-methyltransferase
LQQLRNDGLHPTPLEWRADAFVVPPEERRPLTESAANADGRLYIQNASSMAAPDLLDPQGTDWVLDLCAAPGGKTTHLAAIMANRGKISAVESVRSRFFRLRRNIELCGASNVRLYHKDGTRLWRLCPEQFDRVLVDAPCTGESRIRVAEPGSYRYWSKRKVSEMASKQTRLLSSAVQCLKPGGVLLYATCSFSPEENEAVVSKVLDRFDGALDTRPLALPVANWQPGFAQWEGMGFRRELCRSVRILPDKVMQGFFICLLQKTRSFDTEQSEDLT